MNPAFCAWSTHSLIVRDTWTSFAFMMTTSFVDLIFFSVHTDIKIITVTVWENLQHLSDILLYYQSLN